MLPVQPARTGQPCSQIERACDQIAANPHLGRRQDVEGVRRRVVKPGGYLIYYSVDIEEQVAAILAISHPARQRPFRDL